MEVTRCGRCLYKSVFFVIITIIIDSADVIIIGIVIVIWEEDALNIYIACADVCVCCAAPVGVNGC